MDDDDSLVEYQRQEVDSENQEVFLEYDFETCTIADELQNEEVIPPPPPKIEIDSSKVLLEPDHPLLASFQRTLKDQLERQLEKLKIEVTELDISIKNKTSERGILGERVYDAQQLVAVQQEAIDKIQNDITKQLKDRSEIETNLTQINKTYNENRIKLSEAERKENEIRSELETLGFLLHKMNEWQEKLQSDMAVNQRITDKSKIDKEKYMEEMRNLDFIIYKLMTEVFRLENSLEHLNMQLRIKEQEREGLGTKISEANIDVEALEQENKRLLHSWNCVLVAIGHRDKSYLAAQKDLENEKEIVKGTIVEISGFKRLSQQAMEKNEQLTVFKDKADMDKANLFLKLQSSQDKLLSLEKKLMDRQAIISQLTKDLEEVSFERRIQDQEISDLSLKTAKQLSIKSDIEERILNMLQEQISSDKISRYMNRSIRDLREKNRNQEIQLALIENKNADILVAVEQQKGLNDECARQLAEAIDIERLKEKQINDHKNEIRLLISECNKSLEQYDIASKKFEELLQQSEGIELTPLEMKIKNLEKRVIELEEKNGKLKALWLREQLYIVTLQKDRSAQIYEINLMNKQTLLLQQKNLKLEDELDELSYFERKHDRNMNNMKARIDKLNGDLWKRRGRKEAMDLTNLTLKIDFVNKLKDEEMTCLQLESKITDMEEEKEMLSRKIVEANREMLAWERKVKLSQETKQSVSKEKSSEGELATMKHEIQRMSIRYGQLRKAQDKLVQDLNHCISRREFMFVSAAATEKRITGNVKVNNRAKYVKRMESLKEKMNKTIKESDYFRTILQESQNLEMQLYENIKESIETAKDHEQEIIDLANKIDFAKFERQKELEILVFKQHKLRAFNSISRNQYRQKFRTKALMEKEYALQASTNFSLLTIAESLITDFPEHATEFTKTLNTLKVTHNE